MKIIFIISAQFLLLFFHTSCGRDDSSTSSVSGRAPRYRAILTDKDAITKGTVLIRKDEVDVETEVHVVSSSLRKNLHRSLIIEGPCPASQDDLIAESIRFDLGREKRSQLDYSGPTPPPLGGHSLVLESKEALLACGPLVPIPLE